MKYKYPLQVYPWSLTDRVKMAGFVLNSKNRFTMGPQVQKYEENFENFYDNHVKAVAVASGSLANHLMLEVYLNTYKINIQNVTFFCNATTWASNLSPIIMRGGRIELVDINKTDLCVDYDELEKAIKKSRAKHKVLWITSLIGFSPNMDRLTEISKKYNCKLFGDLCESTFSTWKGKPLPYYFEMSTTSTFIAHLTTSIEGGMLFINKDLQEHYDNAQLIRNHGLTRALEANNPLRIEAENNNRNIDPQFLFEKVGSNFRLSDLHAFAGILDFKRVPEYLANRTKLWEYFLQKVSVLFYQDFSKAISPFCIPIILSDSNPWFVSEVKRELNEAGWETRPVICDMSIAPAYKHLAKGKSFPNSFWLRDRGFYVGLSNNLTTKDVDKLIDILNSFNEDLYV